MSDTTLTSDELHQLELAIMRAHQPEALWLAFRAMREAAATPAEMGTMTVDAIDIRASTLALWSAKWNRWRRAPISPGLARDLREFAHFESLGGLSRVFRADLRAEGTLGHLAQLTRVAKGRPASSPRRSCHALRATTFSDFLSLDREAALSYLGLSSVPVAPSRVRKLHDALFPGDSPVVTRRLAQSEL